MGDQPPSATATDVLVRRAATVCAAVIAALLVWAIATRIAGVEVNSPEMGDNPVARIGVPHVIAASAAASLVAWAELAFLERFTRYARRRWAQLPSASRIWAGTALLALAASLGAPLTGEGIDAGNRAVLVLLHVVVAAALLAGMLPTTAAARREDAPRDHHEPTTPP